METPEQNPTEETPDETGAPGDDSPETGEDTGQEGGQSEG